MKQSVAILSLLLLISCQSKQVVEPISPEPIRESGCSTYYGAQWQQCIQKQFDKWEKRENTPITIQILDRTRPVIYEQKVRYTLRVCAADFCRDWYEDRNESAWYHEAGKGVLFFGAGYFVGKLTAAKILLPFLF